jgi:hypothetical protein
MLRSLVLFALISFQQAPDPTLPPTDAHVKATAVGLGVQVYKCTPSDNTYQWVLEMPVAKLFDPATRQEVGTHSVGPTWTWIDGSSITGKVLQKRASSDPLNVSWLLLETHSVGAAGMLADVTMVRRSDTQAGVPPMACDAEHQNNEVRVPYQATYTFYTTRK